MKRKVLGTSTAILLASSLVMSSMAFAAGNKNFSLDMSGKNDEAWNYVAMVNDDTVETGVNVRAEANKDGAVAGFLYRGSAVKVLERGENWTKIRSGNISGYVKNDYLVFGNEARGLADYYGINGVSASWDDVKVFASPSANGKILASVDAGQNFEVVSEDDHWITVRIGKDLAYVSSEDVTQVLLVDEGITVNGKGNNVNASESLAGVSGAVYYEESSAAETYVEESRPAENTVAESEAAYSEPTYVAPAENTSYTETSVSAGVSINAADYSDAQAAANAAYQIYLEAQAAADAAQNGSDENLVYTTAAAASAAYAEYVRLQNIADAAAYGSGGNGASSQTTVENSTSNAGSGQTDETYSDADGSEDYEYDDGTDDGDWDGEDASDSYFDTSDEDYDAEFDYVDDDEDYDDEDYDDGSTSSSYSASSSDLDLMAAIIYCEAGNQSYEGKVAVGAVVMNRVASPSFPNTISEVLYQDGQFYPASSGVLENAIANGVPSSCYDAASAAMAGENPVGGALYFNTGSGKGMKLGDHQFY